jgi:hypothetical protein
MADGFQSHCLKLLEVLFRLDRSEIQSWPGSLTYMAFLQRQIMDMTSGLFEPVLLLFGFPCPALPVNVVQFMICVAETVCTSTECGSSINEILDITAATKGIRIDSPEARIAGQHAIFCFLGWTTMLFRPSRPPLGNNKFCLSVLDEQTTIKSCQSIESAKRPIAGFLRGLGPLLPPFDSSQYGQIHSSTINYYALSTIGKVNIKWVDTLSAHLEFHPLTRTLLVFRFPTFCALNCQGTDESNHCFDKYVLLSELEAFLADRAYRLLQDYYPLQHQERKSLSSFLLPGYKREVLLSYRLLFGQHRRSRKAFMTNLRKTAAGKDELLDPLLVNLCGRGASSVGPLSGSRNIWSKNRQDANGNLQEADTYSIEVDFPMLGPRLANLQQWCLNQSPSRIRDLWRDHRNPMQWYTLWAVLIIGSLSLLLTLVQVLLSIAQLVISAKQQGCC